MSSIEENTFNQIADQVIGCLQNQEQVSISLNCERSQFTRFNNGKIRQSGLVHDGTVTISLVDQSREAYSSFPFTGNLEIDREVALENLAYLRSQVKELPPNPYIVLPEAGDSSREVYRGELLDSKEALAAILEPVGNLDFTGLYAAGIIMRGIVNSVNNAVGQKHWFATDNFVVDYSIFTKQDRAVKGMYAGQNWNQSAYNSQINQSRQQISALDLSAKHIARGEYRVYFAPSATADLIGMITGAVGAAALQQGSSALLKLQTGEKELSNLFNLKENFQNGTVPRFNELGVIAPEELSVIKEGKLINPLVSAKTAKEYNLIANGASNGEYMRSPVVETGKLAQSEILSKLGTGLYLSNLHYLNWSDRSNGRITGMTRYACFWVENGEIIAPIENLRFDDSIYDFLNHNLEAFTDFSEFIPNTDTYGSRSLGGILTPGMLVKNFTFTL
ncbi:putative Zn-dependent protease-like protein [Synechococcus sp. PCC 7502]|uniref:TldD/PmbA family protein n=1 Tax=Synechococcus sp. PCC 7502 TaxID=1173263 RepID=UPI00029F9455|nr:TldD/PmbA family protein [Synechococcus sp. PCC 7502]AFY75276.1 putative Zn-dependent protease-like protein [Synechococcus sp. PCC 7502]